MTYNHPRIEDDLLTCAQKSNEHLREFIRRFGEIHNTIHGMSEDHLIMAFKQGCKDKQTMEKLATKNPKTVTSLFMIVDVNSRAVDARA